MFMPGVWILWSKKNVIIFQKENGNTFTLFIIFIVKSLQKEQNSTNLLLYDPQSAGINLQSPQSNSTPWTLTLNGHLPLVIKPRNNFFHRISDHGEPIRTPIVAKLCKIQGYLLMSIDKETIRRIFISFDTWILP